jgi:hypothetical protein
VFHVSLLRKVDVDPARILPQVPVEVKEDLTLELRPIRILDQEVKELRSDVVFVFLKKLINLRSWEGGVKPVLERPKQG